MAYQLGKRSRQRLDGVHPDLVRVVERAIDITRVDFTVLEGLRTVERQTRLLRAGSSTTMQSRHLTGHAVDLGAWVDGTLDWSWPPYYKMAEAMKQAAEERHIRIEWGGCWACINHNPDLEQAMARYIQRKKADGKTPFIDGPHFQLPWEEYRVDADFSLGHTIKRHPLAVAMS